MDTTAYLNRISTATPQYEVHDYFLQVAESLLAEAPRKQALFRRMSKLGGIDHRYSCFEPAQDANSHCIDRAGLWKRGDFPSTAKRMELYEDVAPKLALQAVQGLALSGEVSRITHLIVTSCTGFYAPGIDLDIVARCGLSPSVERTLIGFMGCYAAINALKLARHIVRSDSDAQVLIVNVEICTLHLRETDSLENLASFCLWGDGCAASLVTARPTGLSLDAFEALVAKDRADLMTWKISDDGFHMVLSGQVPTALRDILRAKHNQFLGGMALQDIDLWAVHPGGRSVLDAVDQALGLGAQALQRSRDVLRDFGNMSSATIMFVLAKMMSDPIGQRGCAMAFGPGLTAETMLFGTI